MISIITTAINRPAILKKTIDSLLKHSDFAKQSCRWIVNIDLVAKLPDAKNAFDETIAVAKSYEKTFETIVLPNPEAKGPANALNRIRPHIKGDVVFYLEDDWVCHPSRKKKGSLVVGEFLEVLKKHAYSTCVARLQRCSFNPCFIRRANYEIVTTNLETSMDAEVQANRVWLSRQKVAPADWSFDPVPKDYFSDLGREWIEKTPLVKWDMHKRYNKPTVYTTK